MTMGQSIIISAGQFRSRGPWQTGADLGLRTPEGFERRRAAGPA
ncbi:hypothetical protein [Kitasatospora sp. NPDC056531]